MMPNIEKYYHYTTVAGAFGIISNRSIWLTDYRYLNDKSELVLAWKLFTSALTEKEKGAFERAFMFHNAFYHHCILSLSRSPTVLSQWRAYASDGSGIALGFSRDRLEKQGLKLVPCRYAEHSIYIEHLKEEYAVLIKDLVQASRKYRAINEFTDWLHKNRIQEFNRLIEDLFAIKNPAFAEEQEVRAVQTHKSGTVKVRTARDLIIPYIETNIWDDDPTLMYIALPEIWLGPKCNPLNEDSLRSMYPPAFFRIQRYDCGYV